jgi:hypothetical protein
MKNQKVIFIALGTLFFSMSSCTKEETTEQYITNNLGPDVYIYSQEGLEDILRDVEPAAEVWTLDDQITSIELGSLNEGDLIVAETQIRIRDLNNCESRIGVNSGPLISTSIFSVPTLDGDDEGIIAFEVDGPVRVGYLEGVETSVYFERIHAVVIDTTVENAYATFWLNAYSSNCATTNGEGIRAELGTMVISVYRN